MWRSRVQYLVEPIRGNEIFQIGFGLGIPGSKHKVDYSMENFLVWDLVTSVGAWYIIIIIYTCLSLIKILLFIDL